MNLDGRIRGLEKRVLSVRSGHVHYIWKDEAGEVVQLVCSLGAKCDAGVPGRSGVGIEPDGNPQYRADTA